jgi:hypothetical protein
MFEFDTIETTPDQRTLKLTLELTPEEVELALTTDGISLRRSVMMALVAAMVTAESYETSKVLARFLPWMTSPDPS